MDKQKINFVDFMLANGRLDELKSKSVNDYARCGRDINELKKQIDWYQEQLVILEKEKEKIDEFINRINSISY